MIKELIKKQIKKTGTYRVVEIEAQKLKNQIIALQKQTETETIALQKQIQTLKKQKQTETIALQKQIQTLKKQKQTLKKQKQTLKNERPGLAGYSMKRSLRGLSADGGKPVILKYILENIKKNQKILDVGFGSGLYGKLLRTFYYQNIDGIDVFDKNLEELGLHLIYDNIYIENILDFDFEFYDLIIMGDVLEHIELEAAKKLITKFVEEKKCNHLIVSIPFESEQGEIQGNVYEIHLQNKVTAGYMEKHYPYLRLIDLYYNSNLGTIKATYIWNKDLKINP